MSDPQAMPITPPNPKPHRVTGIIWIACVTLAMFGCWRWYRTLHEAPTPPTIAFTKDGVVLPDQPQPATKQVITVNDVPTAWFAPINPEPGPAGIISIPEQTVLALRGIQIGLRSDGFVVFRTTYTNK